MYKILLDTNIFVDFLLRRPQFYKDSEKVISLCEELKIKGYVTTTILMDLHYIIKKYTHSNANANMAIKEITNVFEVLDVTKTDIENSISDNSRDFEDYVIENCSNRNKIDFIVTRNIKDFKSKKTKIVDPSELINIV